MRETEILIKKLKNPEEKKLAKEKDQESITIENDLADRLGLKVSISHNKKGKGKLVISYSEFAELETLIAKIK